MTMRRILPLLVALLALAPLLLAEAAADGPPHRHASDSGPPRVRPRDAPASPPRQGATRTARQPSRSTARLPRLPQGCQQLTRGVWGRYLQSMNLLADVEDLRLADSPAARIRPRVTLGTVLPLETNIQP